MWNTNVFKGVVCEGLKLMEENERRLDLPDEGRQALHMLSLQMLHTKLLS